MKKEGFELFYKENVDSIYRYIFAFLKNKDDAEDITSEVFVRFYEGIQQGKEIENKRAWLFGIGRNLLKEKYKRLARMDEGEDMTNIKGTEDTIEEITITDDLKERLLELFEKLDDFTKEIMMLRLWEGLAFKEIGGILEIKSTMARKRFSRGVAKIRKMAKEEERKGKKLYAMPIGGILYGLQLLKSSGALQISSASRSALWAKLSHNLFMNADIMKTQQTKDVPMDNGLAKFGLKTWQQYAVAGASVVLVLGGITGALFLINGNNDKGNADNGSESSSEATELSDSNHSSNETSSTSEVTMPEGSTHVYYLKDGQVWSIGIHSKEQKQITGEDRGRIRAYDVSEDQTKIAYTYETDPCSIEQCTPHVSLLDLETGDQEDVYTSKSLPNGYNVYAATDPDNYYLPINDMVFSHSGDKLYFTQYALFEYDVASGKVTELNHNLKDTFAPVYSRLDISPSDSALLVTITEHETAWQDVFSIADEEVVYTYKLVGTIGAFPDSIAGFASDTEVYFEINGNRNVHGSSNTVPAEASDSLELIDIYTNEKTVLVEPGAIEIHDASVSDGHIIVSMSTLTMFKPAGYSFYIVQASDEITGTKHFAGKTLVEEYNFNYKACYVNEDYILTVDQRPHDTTTLPGYGDDADQTFYIFGLSEERNERLVDLPNQQYTGCRYVNVR